MHFVSIRELSRSPSKYVNMTSNGEYVIVTRNGKPKAVLLLVDEDDIEDLILARRNAEEHTELTAVPTFKLGKIYEKEITRESIYGDHLSDRL